MKKLIIVLILILMMAGGFWAWQKKISSQNGQDSPIEINGQKIVVEIADTDAKRRQGLSGRENLCVNCGMLFVFPRASNYSFWMKEMKFNLDILWISGNQVVKIVKNIPFEKGEGEMVDPQIQADKVLEIKAGKSEEWGIKEGDLITFDIK